MIKITHKGDFSKVYKYLKKNRESKIAEILEHYGEIGVEALRSSTPKDTGLTSNSWRCTITVGKDRIELHWYNTNIQNGVPIALILQYGHATGTGGWVEGRDYINPAIRPIFDKIEKDLWKEMTEV